MKKKLYARFCWQADVDHKMKGYINHACYATNLLTEKVFLYYAAF